VLALALNGVLVVVLVMGAVASGSLGLLADAGHDLADVGALAISLLAVRLARRPPSARRSFGWHRATILAAETNAVTLLVVSAVVVLEAARRLAHPSSVHGGLVAVLAGGALAVNLLAAASLGRHDHDLNMRGALVHLLGDAAASAAVLVAGLGLVAWPSARWLDPVAAIVVALVIAWHAVKLLRASLEILLESTPEGVVGADLVAAIAAVEGVEQVHDVHVWSLSSEVRALAAHVVLEGHPSLEEAQEVVGRVRGLLAERFAIAHATIEQECEPCGPPDVEPCAIHDLEFAAPPEGR